MEQSEETERQAGVKPRVCRGVSGGTVWGEEWQGWVATSRKISGGVDAGAGWTVLLIGEELGGRNGPREPSDTCN